MRLTSKNRIPKAGGRTILRHPLFAQPDQLLAKTRSERAVPLPSETSTPVPTVSRLRRNLFSLASGDCSSRITFSFTAEENEKDHGIVEHDSELTLCHQVKGQTREEELIFDGVDEDYPVIIQIASPKNETRADCIVVN